MAFAVPAYLFSQTPAENFKKDLKAPMEIHHFDDVEKAKKW